MSFGPTFTFANFSRPSAPPVVLPSGTVMSSGEKISSGSSTPNSSVSNGVLVTPNTSTSSDPFRLLNMTQAGPFGPYPNLGGPTPEAFRHMTGLNPFSMGLSGAFSQPNGFPLDFKSSEMFTSAMTGPHGLPACYYDPTMSAAFPYGTDRFGNPIDLNCARRKNATRETTAALKAWLYEHRKNPYPTKGEKIMLAIITKMTLTQVSTWFANARRRLKKENKMTWSPRNRTGEEDGEDNSEAGEDVDDVSIDGDEHPQTHLIENEGHKRPRSGHSPPPPKIPHADESESPAPKKPKIWSLAETAGATTSKSDCTTTTTVTQPSFNLSFNPWTSGLSPFRTAENSQFRPPFGLLPPGFPQGLVPGAFFPPFLTQYPGGGALANLFSMASSTAGKESAGVTAEQKSSGTRSHPSAEDNSKSD